MNFHTPDMGREPTREEAEAALAVLRRWADGATDVERSDLDPALASLIVDAPADYPDLSSQYPVEFEVDAA